MRIITTLSFKNYTVLLLLLLTSCSNDKDFKLESGNLVYKAENLPDFSFAGYKKSETEIPDVPVVAVIYPEKNKDKQNIQRIVDSVSKLPVVNGFRGAILLKAGRYSLDGNIKISSSGIVLRGEGKSNQGTYIVATATGSKLPKGINERQTSGVFSFSGTFGKIEKNMAGTKITKSETPVGARSIEVQNASIFNPGDTIAITKTTDAQWIEKLGMAQYGWTPQQYQIEHIRVISNITGNVIHLDIPMVDHIRADEGGGIVSGVVLSGRISNCGVEHILIESVFTDDEDENHSWTAVSFSGVTNSWVRHVNSKNFSFANTILSRYSDFNTIQDCAFYSPKSKNIGDRRYPFYISGGTGNLIQRCFSEDSRHDYATSARVTGPNVFLDCYAHNSFDEVGPHHRWATGTLYDNVYAARIAARNRAGLGTGHGWTAAYNMFWNCYASKGFSVESPPGHINWVVGGTGAWASKDSYVLGFGAPVSPRSLFIDQLTKRIGASKAAVILTSEQHEGSLWSMQLTDNTR